MLRRGGQQAGCMPFLMRSNAATYLLLFLLAILAVTTEPVASARVRVIDGDTIELDGRRPHIRLIGLNAPETSGLCPAESRLGRVATDRLRALVAAGPVDFQRMPCACDPGTEGTPACNHGRICGRLSVAGRDVAAILISEGLAVAFHRRATRCPPLPRPWCPG